MKTNSILNRQSRAGQKGTSLVVVLGLLSVMLIGVASIARMSEANTLIAGNVASKDISLQASEVGVSTAYAAIRALADPNTGNPAWYFPTYAKSNDLKNGVDTSLPQFIDWNNNTLTKTVINGYTVRYVVERFCSVTPVTDKGNQCMIKRAFNGNSGKSGTEDLESPPGTEYRITVNVQGPKESSTFVQALITN